MSKIHPLMAILREARASSGMTMQRAAARTGYDASSIKRWESGESVPKLDVLEDYANLFGYSVVLRCNVDNNGKEEKKDWITEV